MITIVRKSVSAEDQPIPAKPIYRFEPPADRGPDVNVEIVRAENPIQSKAPLVASCWHEFSKTLLSRKALSNTIFDLVTRNAGQEELRDLYEKIRAYQPVLESLYKRARHVEQHGSLPEGPAPGQPLSIDQLRLKRKALVDERHKTRKKLDNPGRAKPSKILEWQQKLDRANTEYIYVDDQIKKFEGKL